jgi:hypothetical protein
MHVKFDSRKRSSVWSRTLPSSLVVLMALLRLWETTLCGGGHLNVGLLTSSLVRRLRPLKSRSHSVHFSSLWGLQTAYKLSVVRSRLTALKSWSMRAWTSGFGPADCFWAAGCGAG